MLLPFFGCVLDKKLHLNAPKGLKVTVCSASACKEITLYQQVASVCIGHSKRENQNEDCIYTTISKAVLTYHFELQTYWSYSFIPSFCLCRLLSANLLLGVSRPFHRGSAYKFFFKWFYITFSSFYTLSGLLTVFLVSTFVELMTRFDYTKGVILSAVLLCLYPIEITISCKISL